MLLQAVSARHGTFLVYICAAHPQPPTPLPTVSLKTVLITGCSDNGIGSALRLEFRKRGYYVFAAARDILKMTWIKDLDHITPIVLDVKKPTDIKNALETVRKATEGKLDYLVNNAGRNHFMPVLDVEVDEVRELFETNYFAPLAITQAFAPLLIEAKGNISFVTSISGYVNTPWMVLTVVTGGVKTSGQTYFDDLQLPGESLYKSVEKTIVKRAKGGDGMPRMDAGEFAKAVVDEMQKGKAGKFWYGEFAEMVRGAMTNVEVPVEVMDAQMIQGTGLNTWKSSF
ncbi:NAD(P)-binding protein [Setomelanomma holmii]|uniref:NAD(P)-binding protein n=1 Tax=Setomelanomma holmii TaxID=210430 RepID=A0A9P4H9P8_9PLEO|nr:NAD(P)-binding protein [Setomelanomma holmii]